MPNMLTHDQKVARTFDCREAFPAASSDDCTNFGHNTKNISSSKSFFSKTPKLTINGVTINTLDELRSKVAKSGGKRTKRRKSKRKTKRRA